MFKVNNKDTRTKLIKSHWCIYYKGLRLFSFSPKIAHAHISGRQSKKKLKEDHVESKEQEQLLSSHQFIHQFRSCGFWEKYARQLRSIRMYKSKVNYFFTILFCIISETISWAKNKIGAKSNDS